MKKWEASFVALLGEYGTEFVSGEELADKLGCSRAAVWKKVASLRKEGYPIEAVTNRGYRLNRDYEHRILLALRRADLLGIFTPIVLQSVVSTNLVAKNAGATGAKDLSVYVSARQKEGRGRRGKIWISDTEDGLWFSVIFRPKMNTAMAPMLTLLMGLCVSEALTEDFGANVGIKWPNDIVSLENGKKLCGILSETSIEDNDIVYAISGCGINISQDTFPDEITKTATSLRMEGITSSREEVLTAVLKKIATRYPDFVACPQAFIPAFRANCVSLGREVCVISEKNCTGKAIDITSFGDLEILLSDGSKKICTSGEVSVRGMCGYI